MTHGESDRYLIKQNYTCSGWCELLNGITLLDPRGLSLLLVIPINHFSKVSSLTSSGWIRVESSSPEYIHIGWSRAWSGWMRRLRKTSSRSIPVTPSRTSWTTRSTNTFNCAFSSGSPSRRRASPLEPKKRGEVQSTDPGSAGPCSKTRSTASPGPSREGS